MTATTEEKKDRALEMWALVQRTQAGDVEAFGLLYDHYCGTVYRYVYFRCGKPDLAEDLTSEVFYRALKRIDSFTWQGRDFASWLITIARNIVADHFKSANTRLTWLSGFSDQVGGLEKEQDPHPEGRPQDTVVDHISNLELLTAVKALNDEQQECIVLRFLMGYTIPETAQVMDKNAGAIKALQYRAIRALARALPDLAAAYNAVGVK